MRQRAGEREPGDTILEKESEGAKMKRLVVFLTGITFAAQADATVRYFHWDKIHHGKRGNVSALDLSTGKILWESLASKSVNFVQETGAGILTGNDEGEVVLLEKTTGKVIWRCLLQQHGDREIKYFLGESDEGFLVAVGEVNGGDSVFRLLWLVSKEGKLMFRCDDGCTAPLNRERR